MLDRLFCLRHNAIVGGNHQNNDVCGLSATRTHRRKGRVTGRVEESDHAHICFHVVGTDMLGNTTRLTDGNT